MNVRLLWMRTLFKTKKKLQIIEKYYYNKKLITNNHQSKENVYISIYVNRYLYIPIYNTLTLLS